MRISDWSSDVCSSDLFVMLDVNLDNALDFREGLQDSGEIYPALKQLSKYARKVVTADDLPLAVRQSVISASTGRPGPSVLDLGFQVLVSPTRSEEHTSELQSLMRISYAVFCLNKTKHSKVVYHVTYSTAIV